MISNDSTANRLTPQFQSGKAGRVALLLVIVVSGMGLLAYLPGLRTLGSIRENYIPMAPSTSLSFMVLSVFLLAFDSCRSSGCRYLFSAAVLGVALFGFLEVPDLIFGTDLNFESSLVPYLGALHGIPIARMSPSTGFGFFLSGVIVLMMTGSRKGTSGYPVIRHLRGGLILVLILMSFVFCLAYLYGTPLMYSDAPTIPMALTTSVNFFLLSFVLARLNLDAWPLSLLVQDDTRSYLVRFILPLTVFSAIAGGIAIVFSIQDPVINPAVVLSFFTLVVVVIAAVVTSVVADHLGKKIDRQQNAITTSQQALAESEARFRNLFDTMAEGVIFQDATGKIISINAAGAKILGVSPQEIVGKTPDDRSWKIRDKDKKDLPVTTLPPMKALRDGKHVGDILLGIFNRKINDYVWVIVNSNPMFRDHETKPFGVYSIFLDITSREKSKEQLEKLKENLEKEVEAKTRELQERVTDLEHFHDVTIEREIRMKELADENQMLKNRKE